MTMTTMTRSGHLGVCGVVMLIAGCSRAAPEATPQKAEPQVAAKAAPAPSLDKRTPLPLTEMMATHQKQEMRDHLRVVQEITVALAKDDFDAVAASAARIAYSDKQAMMCKHMGAGAPGFTEMGEAFHHTADGIAVAAKARDRVGVATALGATLEKCIGCHDTYRQEIVDGAAAEQLMSGMGGMGGMDHSMMTHGK
jgi:hypothetical protein